VPLSHRLTGKKRFGTTHEVSHKKRASIFKKTKVTTHNLWHNTHQVQVGQKAQNLRHKKTPAFQGSGLIAHSPHLAEISAGIGTLLD
jgi:hypothetical protein